MANIYGICVSMSIRANNLIISVCTIHTIWVSNTTYNKKIERKDENRQGYKFSFLPNTKIHKLLYPKWQYFFGVPTQILCVAHQTGNKKYFHIWSGPNRVFWNAKDYGFLSVKKVKKQFLAKWRNEDWRFLQFFDHMKTEYCRLSTLLFDATKIIKK